MLEFSNFIDRYNYLKLTGVVGAATFGGHRHVNQMLYKSDEWLEIRDEVIRRDNGCDLGIPGREINEKILIHHINPITLDDILNRHPWVFDLNNLICTSKRTHDAIHYGDSSLLLQDPIVRNQNDTCPWKR